MKKKNCARVTSSPEVIGSSVGLVHALVLSGPANARIVRHSEAIPAPGGSPLVSAITWCCFGVGFKTWEERNRGPWRDPPLESFSSEAGGRECGCNVHYIWPMSFGRKSPPRHHPVSLCNRRR